MKPIKFKHQNTTYAVNQDEYMNLPALKLDTEKGEVISCWELSFKERIKILFSGKIWLMLVSFNKRLTPSFLSVYRKDVYFHPDDVKKTNRKFFKIFPIGKSLTKRIGKQIGQKRSNK